MTTAADVIAALQQRRQGQAESALAAAAAGSWARWLQRAPIAAGERSALAPAALLAVLQARPLRPPPRRAPALGRGQALLALLRPGWTPAPRDERGLRIAASVLDIVLHVVLVGLLLWLMYLRFLALATPPQDDSGSVVQVEFIGRGNRAAGGGAMAAAAPARTGRPSAPAAIRNVPPPPAERLAVANEPAAALARPAPPEPAPAAQPLEVSQTPQPPPAEAFQLPPPRQREVVLRTPELREVGPRQQVEEIATAPEPVVRTLQAPAAAPQLRMPTPVQRPLELDVPEPQRMPEITARRLPAAANAEPTLREPQVRGELREIPLPAGAEAGTTGSAASGNAPRTGAVGGAGEARTGGQANAGDGAGQAPAASGGRGVAASGSGAGPRSTAAPGGWPGAAKSDDWGASARNTAGSGNGAGDASGRGQAGGQRGEGLFDRDGRVRLPDAWAQGKSLDLDRAGTWLKRPGLEYRATRFDKYWIPDGTLLEEWVRRGIKELSIPIPGTGLQLKCVVSLLQLGAGCVPVDPDVNEQPARPRPPPDVPFKPALQEDNGSVRP
ncbi:hypothetical protein [Thermomonas flagellata]|uniref:hypothetical protein n=1 Tax=Thermomonas flagellata TaxID=2888524 RepID=UPI001F04464C|nr:hypothetical protein [Thermomonas flagellata]